MDTVSKNKLETKKFASVSKFSGHETDEKKLVYLMILYSQEIISIIAGKMTCIVNMVSPIFNSVMYMNTGADLEVLFGGW